MHECNVSERMIPKGTRTHCDPVMFKTHKGPACLLVSRNRQTLTPPNTRNMDAPGYSPHKHMGIGTSQHSFFPRRGMAMAYRTQGGHAHTMSMASRARSHRDSGQRQQVNPGRTISARRTEALSEYMCEPSPVVSHSPAGQAHTLSAPTGFKAQPCQCQTRRPPPSEGHTNTPIQHAITSPNAIHPAPTV